MPRQSEHNIKPIHIHTTTI